MASLNTVELLPKTSQDAIRDFNERYIAGISKAPVNMWASDYGDVIDVDTPYTTFPISLLSTKFVETTEQLGRFKSMASKDFDLKTKEFDAGYEAKLIDLFTKSFAYRKWTDTPAAFVDAAAKLIRLQLAALIEGGTGIVSPWDGVNFFSAASHLANPKNAAAGSFGNFQAAATDPASITNLRAEMASMMLVPDENGDKLGVMPDTILLPTQKYLAVSHLLAQNFLANGETNSLFGKLTPVHVPELTDVNDWYLVDSKLIKSSPAWVAARYFPPAPLGFREWDESSDFFKDTGKIKVAAHIWNGFGLVFPHAIRRVTGA